MSLVPAPRSRAGWTPAAVNMGARWLHRPRQRRLPAWQGVGPGGRRLVWRLIARNALLQRLSRHKRRGVGPAAGRRRAQPRLVRLRDRRHRRRPAPRRPRRGVLVRSRRRGPAVERLLLPERLLRLMDGTGVGSARRHHGGRALRPLPMGDMQRLMRGMRAGSVQPGHRPALGRALLLRLPLQRLRLLRLRSSRAASACRWPLH